MMCPIIKSSNYIDNQRASSRGVDIVDQGVARPRE